MGQKRCILTLGLTGALVACFLFLMIVPCFAETDVTGQVELVKGRLSYDRLTKTSYFDVSVKNVSQSVLLTPIKVILDNFSPTTVKVENADGMTSDGKPYFVYDDSFANAGQLNPDSISLSKRIRFSNPYSVRFTYSNKVLGLLPTPESTLERASSALTEEDKTSFLNNIPSYEQRSMKNKLNNLSHSELHILSDAIKTSRIINQNERYIQLESTLIFQDGTTDVITFEMIFQNGAWRISSL